MKIEFIDATRAYYQAAATREIYVELPPGDREEGMCGKLLKSLQGTRDAAMNWEATYSKVLRDVGFITGKSSPCIFYHPQRNIRITVHGDDFTAMGPKDGLDRHEAEFCKQYELTVAHRLGPGPDDTEEARKCVS